MPTPFLLEPVEMTQVQVVLGRARSWLRRRVGVDAQVLRVP
jgi:hypothetical protein